MSIGTSGCFTSLDHCGAGLKGVEGRSRCSVQQTACTRCRGEHHLGNQRPCGAQKERTMSNVFVVDTDKHPLTPVHPGRARLLLQAGKAAVYRKYPFTIILKRRVEEPAPASLRLKIDPGARTTGLALVDDARGEVIWAAELTHRGEAIKRALDKRRAIRRGRRSRMTRYRAPRFDNRRRRAGWLPPSLLSRVANILTWITRITQLCNVAALSQELVRFDLQKLENPEIAGVDYQQGTLLGYELKE